MKYKLKNIFFYVILTAAAISALVFTFYNQSRIYKIQEHNKLSKPLYMEGHKLYQSGRYQEALENYSEIIENYRKSDYLFDSLQESVKVLRVMGRREEKKEYMKKFYEYFPDHEKTPEYLLRVADMEMVYFRNESGAEEFYELIIEDFPNTSFAESAKRRRLDRIKGVYVKKPYRDIQDLSCDEEKDYRMLMNAKKYYMRGRMNDAGRKIDKISRPVKDFIKESLYYRKILVWEDPSADNHRMLGKTYQKYGFFNRAQEEFRKADEVEN